ncbi:DDE-type integrase/transposase/recombinase [Rhodococcus sp. JS3073]|uniref:DDE-type integrase/transposase/recombinase n=1 Tax=Rhodococcus sp. JS3073 TaxID=3002901 RepID=UPI00228571BF|nr:DDE-type integrase/transposase/recombinase [Rhodococcus sp. JS3073]WAM16731.1 DDE-type integrase/transposase/recombinase [Rhodococcus sp. JS3073]
MTGTDAVMDLLHALLVLAHATGADMFDGNFARWCADHGISRATAYRHKKRIEEEGRWTTRSRRPTSCPHATPLPVEIEIVRLRLNLPHHERGADTIAYHLQAVADKHHWAAEGWTIPSRATINTILSRYDLVIPEPKKRPESSYRRFCYRNPRDCYQIDATQVRLATGEKVVVFEVLDDCTRTLVATRVADAETAAGAIAAITAAFTGFGIPALVLADNGSAFTSRRTKGGISGFTRVVEQAGARLIHSTPYHPQTCGKVERHHRTFKQWLAARPTTAATTAELQQLCETYQRFYNTERPHSAVKMPPLQAWRNAAIHGGPQHLPIQHDATVHALVVSSTGTVCVDSRARLSVGRKMAGQTVTLLRDDDHVTAYTTDGDVIGHLHLDHTKRYQGKLRPA